MKQSEKGSTYSIAWFKIAECVTRGEKERALGIYRLLSHSLGDAALAYQLEGDIFLSCGDTQRAIEVYMCAAKQYELQNKYEQAAGIYEHIYSLKKADSVLYESLLNVYFHNSNSSKYESSAYAYVDFLITCEPIEHIQKTLDEILLKIKEDEQRISFCERVLYHPFISGAKKGIHIRIFLIQYIITFHQETKNKEAVEQFLQRAKQNLPVEALALFLNNDDEIYK